MKFFFLIFSVLILTTHSSSNQAKLESEIIDVKKKEVIQKGENVDSKITFINSDSTIRVDINNLSIRVDINNPESKKNKLKFRLRINNQLLKGEAKLVLIESDGKFELPESSPVADENANIDYICDRTYAYDSPKLNLAFLLEKGTRKRMLLVVNRSKIKMIKDNFYTLHRTNNK